jgi:hypothetical protein
MRKHIALGGLIALGFGVQTFAADGLNYNLLDGGYGYVDPKGGGSHGDELSLAGSYAFRESYFGFGRISTVASSGPNTKGISLGVGYHREVSPGLDLVSGLSYEMVDRGSTGNGFGVSVGLRGRAMDKLELSGGAQYVNVGHGRNGVVFGMGGRYYFTDAIAAGADIGVNGQADTTTLGLKVRYYFGR